MKLSIMATRELCLALRDKLLTCLLRKLSISQSSLFWTIWKSSTKLKK